MQETRWSYRGRAGRNLRRNVGIKLPRGYSDECLLPADPEGARKRQQKDKDGKLSVKRMEEVGLLVVIEMG